MPEEIQAGAQQGSNGPRDSLVPDAIRMIRERRLDRCFFGPFFQQSFEMVEMLVVRLPLTRTSLVSELSIEFPSAIAASDGLPPGRRGWAMFTYCMAWRCPSSTATSPIRRCRILPRSSMRALPFPSGS